MKKILETGMLPPLQLYTRTVWSMLMSEYRLYTVQETVQVYGISPPLRGEGVTTLSEVDDNACRKGEPQTQTIPSQNYVCSAGKYDKSVSDNSLFGDNTSPKNYGQNGTSRNI